MMNPLKRSRRKTITKKVSDLAIGDCVVYPTGVGEVTEFTDEKRIEATGSLYIRFFKMDMISGTHKGGRQRDGLPWEDTIEVFRKPKEVRMFTRMDALAYTCCAFFVGSGMTVVTTWLS